LTVHKSKVFEAAFPWLELAYDLAAPPEPLEPVSLPWPLPLPHEGPEPVVLLDPV